jgi:uncharacterized RDD family membrane protein YckC
VTDPYTPPTIDPASPAYAAWWRRVVAILIDGLIVSIPMSILVFGVLGFEFFADRGQGLMLTPAVRPGGLIIQAAQVAYYTFLNGGERGQTLGKQVLGIRVRDVDADAPIGYGRALLRHTVIPILGLLCGLITLVDGLWPLWDDKKQALHDKLARSIVVMA